MAGPARAKLETAILAGPPREMYGDHIPEDQWHSLVLRSVWLHLAKLNNSGGELGPFAAARLMEISTAHPQWCLAPNESDEFMHWMSGTGDSDFEESRDVEIAPRKWDDLKKWLIKPSPRGRPFYEDTWRDVCRTRFFHGLYALSDLAKINVWPDGRWSEALQVWSEGSMVIRSWRYAAPVVQAMPNAVLQKISHSVTWWIEAVSKSINRHENILLELCSRVLSLPLEAGSGSRVFSKGVETYDPVGSAINHPIGLVTQALINIWFKKNPNDNDLLPIEIEPFFTQICDVQEDRLRHGRVLLGSRLVALFRVNRQWTMQNLFPLFSWSDQVEAASVWEGFLWSPRIYHPLLTALKLQFLDCAGHYTDLGQHRQQFAAFLTYAALSTSEGFTADEFRNAIGKLPPEGLAESAQALYQALASSGDQCEEYWRGRAKPFWQNVWPKSRNLATPRISEFLALTAIAARGEFPAALSAIQNWLQPIEHPHTIVHSLQTSGLCRQFPADALLLLNAMIVDQRWGLQEVGQCLDEIERTAPKLGHDINYQRLREYSRRIVA